VRQRHGHVINTGLLVGLSTGPVPSCWSPFAGLARRPLSALCERVRVERGRRVGFAVVVTPVDL